MSFLWDIILGNILLEKGSYQRSRTIIGVREKLKFPDSEKSEVRYN